jgi:two-component system OmpR family sensor kinase
VTTADAARSRRPARPLRRRLVLGIVALLAAASLIVGVVSVLALRGFLMERLDEQLAAATGRTQLASSGDAETAPRPPGGDFSTLRFGVQGPLTITAVVVGDAVRAGIVTPEGEIRILTDDESAALRAIPADGEPATVDLGTELGEYRAAADEIAPGVYVVTGLPLAEVTAPVNTLIAVIAVVALLVLAAAAVAGHTVVRLALRPLDRVAATAAQVAELPLTQGDGGIALRVADVDADPRTEVGQVGAAINRMLGHVASALEARQASENKVRRFVADASHELRTPLTSIRGYAELTRRGGYDLPDDVVRSIGRVESEAIRMTSLVEDLLLLARLDEGRDLEKKPVDLSRLLIDAVGDAHVTAPGHRWRLDLPEEPLTVEGDAGRLHQVLSNLLANAAAHTPEGTQVTVTLASDGAEIVLGVIDDGPGIAPELVPRLFERFARGDDSRSRNAGSTGLGLAIVRAVVEGHGGTVSVASEPGRTEFIVRLPGQMTP